MKYIIENNADVDVLFDLFDITAVTYPVPSDVLSVIVSLCSWVIFVYVDAVYWFYGCSFLC